MFGINAVPRLQALLERVRCLTSLSLCGCSLRPGLLHLTRFPLLERLFLDDVDGLSDVWLLLCAKLPNLKTLRINNNRNITARGFAQLPSLSRCVCSTKHNVHMHDITPAEGALRLFFFL